MTGRNKEEMYADMVRFADKARDLRPKCSGNEFQTQVSLINPFLEILGYDARNPDVVQQQFTADIYEKSREKIDYAVIRDGNPWILIEAKSAEKDIRSDRKFESQLRRYFHTQKASFGVLTNGIVWCWYRSGNDGHMEEKPFKTHDVSTPKESDVDWLWSVSGYEPDSDNAEQQAEAEHIRSLVRTWINELRRSPSDNFIKFLVKEMHLGVATRQRVDKVKEHFKYTFDDYIESETKRVLDTARNQLDKDAGPEEPERKTADAPPVENDGPDGPAWRVGEGDWNFEKNGILLQLAVCRYMAALDIRGKESFYREAESLRGGRVFLEAQPQESGSRYEQVDPPMPAWMSVHMNNDYRRRLIRHLCDQVQTRDGAPIRLGEEIEIRLPGSSAR